MFRIKRPIFEGVIELKFGFRVKRPIFVGVIGGERTITVNILMVIWSTDIILFINRSREFNFYLQKTNYYEN